MAEYKPTIGLEIHAELKTRTKMFCDCLNDPEEKHPNINVCAICAGHPGTLPTINQEAVNAILKVGIALNGNIPQFSKFDRKNYFYPDLPKGYQISQYDLPLVFGGVLKGVRLRRIHLEEDTGRLIHLTPDNKQLTNESVVKSQLSNVSLVDFNRAGVPLMELVTEPDLHNADEAVEFAKELQLILRYLGVSDADMEKGQMRVEANLSVSRDENFGVKVELKNINSFKAVHDAIEYEIKRQIELIGKGEKIKQETRGWDDKGQKTVAQRSKEEAHDYRYFPEPDLPPLDLSKFDWQSLKQSVPELPAAKRLRFAKEFNLAPEQAEILAADRETAEFFEEVVSELNEELASDAAKAAEAVKLTYNYFTTDFFGLLAQKGIALEESKVDPENFSDLIVLIANGKINSRTAKDLIPKMLDTGLDPREIVKQEGLEQVSDIAGLETAAKEIMAQNPEAVADFKKGKENALQFLVGKAMAKLKGKANPTILQEIFKKLLSS